MFTLNFLHLYEIYLVKYSVSFSPHALSNVFCIDLSILMLLSINEHLKKITLEVPLLWVIYIQRGFESR